MHEISILYRRTKDTFTTCLLGWVDHLRSIFLIRRQYTTMRGMFNNNKFRITKLVISINLLGINQFIIQERERERGLAAPARSLLVYISVIKIIDFFRQ
jgi:hypothetical protein